MFFEIDAGEGEPEELWELADALNVACGGHAGDDASMTRIMRAPARIGAHPSYPDRASFGRASVTMELPALTRAVAEQCAALDRIARECGRRIELVKPHGALYHDASARDLVALAFYEGFTSALGWDVELIGPSRGALAELAHHFNVRYLREGFADRRTRADGTLVPRAEPDAIITDPREAAELARALDADAICVHGDNPNALAVARAVRAALA